MFDFHMHSRLSFDSEAAPEAMAAAALQKGLRQICFTDHYDHNSDPAIPANLFAVEEYRRVYDSLKVPGISIRRGVEFGLTRWNSPHLTALTAEYPFDFVLGSVHFVDGVDPYEPRYWHNRTVQEAFRAYLEEVYQCLLCHDGFDVLGHLTYVCKSVHNPSHGPVPLAEHRELTDEILKLLVKKGKGLEVNTSGVDRAGAFLPDASFLRRFRELGGQIVTVGSDAHDPSRVGQYAPQAMQMLQDIFGHVCTYENRQPVFHKL